MPASVPTSEEVTAYLAAHKLEPVIEDAVNDAVLKQVKVRTAALCGFHKDFRAGNSVKRHHLVRRRAAAESVASHC